ncbi:hypothetical protein [Holzapfeliella floricola]|uniref:hypothetical protein n=1 Tax=Holzapfeliella floricola TaxID=679249 RepID=UPI000A64317A|nr:hypothetical protein [Holzapfeliella floricola]
MIYISATHINRIERTQVADIVYEKTPIKTIDDYYQLSRDVKSLAVSGKDDKQENYYMITCQMRKRHICIKMTKENQKKRLPILLEPIIRIELSKKLI